MLDAAYNLNTANLPPSYHFSISGGRVYYKVIIPSTPPYLSRTLHRASNSGAGGGGGGRSRCMSMSISISINSNSANRSSGGGSSANHYSQ